jgi:hypothetical protein
MLRCVCQDKLYVAGELTTNHRPNRDSTKQHRNYFCFAWRTHLSRKYAAGLEKFHEENYR